MNDDKKLLVFCDLNKYLDKVVTVRLFGGKVIRGRLFCYDQVPNIVLKKPSQDKSQEWPYGESLICIGNNIISIAFD